MAAPTPVPRPRSTFFLPSAQTNSIVPPSQSERAADENGVVKVRSGQVIGVSLFSAIQSAYQNLVYHSIAMPLFVFSLILLFEPKNKEASILILTRRLLIERHEAIEQPILKSIPAFIAYLITLIQGFSQQLAYVILCAIPYIVKPSSRNLWFAGILSFIFWIKVLPVIEMVLYSQLFYLFVMLRSPSHRLAISLLFLLFLLSPYFKSELDDGEPEKLSNVTDNFSGLPSKEQTSKLIRNSTERK